MSNAQGVPAEAHNLSYWAQLCLSTRRLIKKPTLDAWRSRKKAPNPIACHKKLYLGGLESLKGAPLAGNWAAAKPLI